MNAEVRMCEYKTNFTAVNNVNGHQQVKVNYPFNKLLSAVHGSEMVQIIGYNKY